MRRILEQLDYSDIPRLLVFNKTDRLEPIDLAERVAGRDVVVISALRSQGVERLLDRIDFVLPPAVRASVH